MDASLVALARRYKAKRDFSGDVQEAVRALYVRFIKEREGVLLDAAAATAAVGGVFLADEIDYSKITPQMEEAFKLGYPNLELGQLARFGPEELQGIISGWKGKYFEVLVRDKLNAGEWVGDVHLEPGQIARLAESPIQPGWDLQILNADGTVAEELQLKATESLGYVKEALERYPDIKVLTTDEVAGQADEITGRILSADISEKELEKTVSGPLEELLDSPMEEILENVAPFLPFLVVAFGEGTAVLVGRKSLELALASGLERVAKNALAAGAGAIAYLAGLGWLSLPISFLARLGFDRYKIMATGVRRVERGTAAIRKIETRYRA